MNTFEIRDPGNDTVCLSVKDLQDKLITKYANKSVAIDTINSRGLRRIICFLNVKNNQVYNSYGNKHLFDFNTLSEKTNANIEKAKKAILNNNFTNDISFNERGNDNVYLQAFVESRGDNIKFNERLKTKFGDWYAHKTEIISAANQKMKDYGIDAKFSLAKGATAQALTKRKAKQNAQVLER